MKLFPVLVFLVAAGTSSEWLSCIILMLSPKQQIKENLHWKSWVQNLSCKNTNATNGNTVEPVPIWEEIRKMRRNTAPNRPSIVRHIDNKIIHS